jgi:hypothetical protein
MTSSTDRPFFIVGHARGGSTLLAAIINFHSWVGPKAFDDRYDNVHDFIKNLKNYDFHIKYSESLEQKDIWFNYFPGKHVFTHMGKEIIIEKVKISERQRKELISKLTAKNHEKRYLSKAPTNSFRVKVIKNLFPDAKILSLYRSGPEVVTSWGQRVYGFGKRVSNDEIKCRKLGYRKGIKIFSKKWFETIEYLESARKEIGFLAVTYDDLIENTVGTLGKIFEYLELPIEEYLYDIKLEDRRSVWKKKIPWWHHAYLIRHTVEGMKLYDQARLFKK